MRDLNWLISTSIFSYSLCLRSSSTRYFTWVSHLTQWMFLSMTHTGCRLQSGTGTTGSEIQPTRVRGKKQSIAAPSLSNFSSLNQLVRSSFCLVDRIFSLPCFLFYAHLKQLNFYNLVLLSQCLIADPGLVFGRCCCGEPNVQFAWIYWWNA